MILRSHSVCSYIYTQLSAVSVCILLSLSVQCVSATEIVKWTDENGKIHFGDRAPIGNQETAEKIKIQHAPVNTPEKDVIKKQTDYWYRQKIEKQKQQEKKIAAKKSAQDAQEKDSTKLDSPEDKRRFCRDTFSHNVKMRTECFNSIK